MEIWSGLFISDPDPDFFTHPGSRIQGSKRHRIPDSQHCRVPACRSRHPDWRWAGREDPWTAQRSDRGTCAGTSLECTCQQNSFLIDINCRKKSTSAVIKCVGPRLVQQGFGSRIKGFRSRIEGQMGQCWSSTRRTTKENKFKHRLVKRIQENEEKRRKIKENEGKWRNTKSNKGKQGNQWKRREKQQRTKKTNGKQRKKKNCRCHAAIRRKTESR